MARARTTGETRSRERDKEARVAAVRQKSSYTNTMERAALVSVDKPLTDQQKAFVAHLTRGESLPNAYQRAGYSIQDISYAYRMMKMPNILAALRKEQEAYQRASDISKRDVIEMLKEAYEMGKLMAESTAMTAAAREIGKLCGYYEPKKVDVNINVGERKKVEQLTDEELFKLIDEAKAEIVPVLEHSDAADSEDDLDPGSS